MYDVNRNTPIFQLDATAQEFKMTGDFIVTGNAVFDTILVNEFESGLQALASTNPADSWDLGLWGKYEQGGVGPTDIYTGIIRDASDIYKRWIFFDGITTTPALTVEGITSSTVASVRLGFIYTNNGSDSAPSITFDSDVDTGIYRVAENEIGMTAEE
jgi:hypothetical protein